MQVKLADLRAKGKPSDEVTRDPLVYLSMHGGSERYRTLTGRALSADIGEVLETDEAIRRQRDTEAFRRTLPKHFTDEQRRRFYGDNALNSTHLPYTRCRAAKIWQTEGLYESEIFGVAFQDDGDILTTVRRRDGAWEYLTIRDGNIIRREEAEPVSEDTEALRKRYGGVPLPCRPERNHLSYASAECPLAGGETLIGTEDGMLTLVRADGSVFSLGAVDDCGAVHSLAASPTGEEAVGAAGDRDGLGTLFRYSRRTGLTLFGRIFFHSADIPGLIGASNQPHYVCWSADGRSVAVGVKDRLACVYCFELPEDFCWGVKAQKYRGG